MRRLSRSVRLRTYPISWGMFHPRLLTSVLVTGTLLLCAMYAHAKIVFRSERDGVGSIYVMDDDGSNVQKLSFPQPHESDGAPAWSPDGNRILFDRNLSRGGQLMELFVMDKDGSNVQQLTHYKKRSGAGTWSPDGTRIAFRSNKTGGLEIYVMDLSTGAVKQLTKNPGNREWATKPFWSPDGKYIAYRQATPPHGTTTIYVMRADGTGQGPLVPGDEWFRYAGGWSKDSQSILYFEKLRGESRVVIQNHRTKARRILKTPKKWQIHAACFIGHDVLISADKDPDPETNADIYRYHISTGKVTNLTSHPADDYSAQWISDTVFSVTPLKKKAIQWGTLKKR